MERQGKKFIKHCTLQKNRAGKKRNGNGVAGVDC